MPQSSSPRSALLVAFHFPPFAGSSGAHRTVALARYLGEFGWNPLILAASPRAYENRTEDPNDGLPLALTVCRAPALDAARHLAIKGRYPRFLSLPDRWISWFAGAVPAGLGLIARHRPKIIWTTYPLASAHLIGWALHRLTGLPWIADFRDPMVELIDGIWYPQDPAVRRSREFTERRVAAAASAATFCTATARSIFVERQRWNLDGRPCHIIENGFDEAEFEAAGRLPSRRDPSRVHLVHSGTLYPGPDRDPGALLAAITRLRERGRLPAAFRLTLRASGHDEIYQPVIDRLGLAGIVELAPALAYHEALREIMDADGLLLFQGHTSNPAIPAKAYEYLRAARPILALVAHDGETAALLRRLNVGTVAPIDQVESIKDSLDRFLCGIAAGTHRVLATDESEKLSRRHRVMEFASLMDRVAAPSAPVVGK